MSRSPLETWRGYARCWSLAPAERGRSLPRSVDASVSYRDPGTDLTGSAELAAYMERFRAAFPGSRFVIEVVHDHHDRSLSEWRQVGADGSVQMRGVSHAVHSRDGRLADITGFFVDQAEEMR